MRLILTKFDDHWVELTGLGGRLLSTVRYGIRTQMRQFDQKTQHWLVHWSQLMIVVGAARQEGVEVEYGTLPIAWQLRAAGAEMMVEGHAATENAFAKLFITDEAPIEVVHAAYRALAKLHHPDAGGTTERFQEIDSAYRRILTLKGC